MTDKGAGAKLTLQIALGVFLGIAAVVAVLVVILANRGPSEAECLNQATDVLYDVRDSVDPACN